jgi:hypothetical protein
MTTQTRKGMKAKVDALAEALTVVAREAQPRPGFFVEPLLRVWEPEDPEGERQAHEVFYFVVDGTEEELNAFHRVLSAEFVRLIGGDPKLRMMVGMGTLFPSEALSAVRP